MYGKCLVLGVAFGASALLAQQYQTIPAAGGDRIHWRMGPGARGIR